MIKAHRECLATPNKSITQNTNRILRTPIVTGHLQNWCIKLKMYLLRMDCMSICSPYGFHCVHVIDKWSQVNSTQRITNFANIR